MEKENYTPEMQKFLDEFIAIDDKDKNLNSGNDKMLHTALWYEKFRRAMEDQEDHLIFKNAISRIVRRRYALAFSNTVESLFDGLMNELAWADYINLDSLTDEQVTEIKSIIGRYIVLLNSVKSHSLENDASKIIIGWMACEIDELLFCHKRQELIVDFAYNCLRENLQFGPGNFNQKEIEIQLKLAILTLVFKPDYNYAQFWLTKKIFPEFSNFNLTQAQEIGFHFENIISQINKVFKNIHSKDYLLYAKRQIAPFILIKELPNYQSNLTAISKDPIKLRDALVDVYDSLLMKTRDKVWRGTIRAFIFIFLTKISLAFIIEMPFDQYLRGSIDYIPLIINIGFPPVLMFLSGISVKTPPSSNHQIVINAINNLITYQRIDSKPFYIGIKHRSTGEKIFDFLYLVFNFGIVIGVILLLRKIGFNFVSILLFFTFVSAVSFFAFRIRNVALELLMRVSRDNFLVSLIEFVFLPFILIGKIISSAITKSNPFTITLDFLIEAPLKTIIKISNSWLRFVRQKKEDLDI